MKTPCMVVAQIVALLLAAVVGAQVQAQFIPPPPAKPPEIISDGFTEHDRILLQNTFALVRSIRAKLFPLEEENRILRLQ